VATRRGDAQFDLGIDGGENHGKLSAVDRKRLTAVMHGVETDELKHPRFTKEEAAASGEKEKEMGSVKL
jgi:hypothetical protein